MSMIWKQRMKDIQGEIDPQCQMVFGNQIWFKNLEYPLD